MTHKTHFKTSPFRNPNYLAYIRTLPCLCCGKKAIAHHVRRLYWGAGTGIKPYDYVTIPLCNECHNPSVESQIDVERVIIDCLMGYIESLR